jgi:hypothetical protein
VYNQQQTNPHRKKREYLKENINELETNNKNKTLEICTEA